MEVEKLLLAYGRELVSKASCSYKRTMLMTVLDLIVGCVVHI